MFEPQWGRLRVDVNCGLRRGAWYRVVSVTDHDAILDVSRRRVSLPRASLTFMSTPPKTWTIVPRPPDVKRLSAEWGEKYAVCPSCRNRAALKTQAEELRCARCHGTFKVAWGDWYLGGDPPAP